MADGRCPNMSAVDISLLKTTQQGIEPVRCVCWRGCIWLAPPGQYDWIVRVRRRCGLM